MPANMPAPAFPAPARAFTHRQPAPAAGAAHPGAGCLPACRPAAAAARWAMRVGEAEEPGSRTGPSIPGLKPPFRTHTSQAARAAARAAGRRRTPRAAPRLAAATAWGGGGEEGAELVVPAPTAALAASGRPHTAWRSRCASDPRPPALALYMPAGQQPPPPGRRRPPPLAIRPAHLPRRPLLTGLAPWRAGLRSKAPRAAWEARGVGPRGWSGPRSAGWPRLGSSRALLLRGSCGCGSGRRAGGLGRVRRERADRRQERSVAARSCRRSAHRTETGGAA